MYCRDGHLLQLALALAASTTTASKDSFFASMTQLHLLLLHSLNARYYCNYIVLLALSVLQVAHLITPHCAEANLIGTALSSVQQVHSAMAQPYS
jgi:hypothetical protein